MERFESIEQILDFAIEREIEASNFYKGLAQKMNDPELHKMLEGFAREEQGHRAKLQAVKNGDIELAIGDVRELGIADYVIVGDLSPDMTYADALILAMKKEKAAYRLYLDLAMVAEAEELTDLFLALAREEANHKLRFEIEYDKNILGQG
jgi:rubrerythrin